MVARTLEISLLAPCASGLWARCCARLTMCTLALLSQVRVGLVCKASRGLALGDMGSRLSSVPVVYNRRVRVEDFAPLITGCSYARRSLLTKLSSQSRILGKLCPSCSSSKSSRAVELNAGVLTSLFGFISAVIVPKRHVQLSLERKHTLYQSR